VPLAFPSHQGLILPLWRRFPDRIDAIALSIGAAMPDIVDACVWPFRGGELGQWMGHSLVGVVVCVPFGLVLTWLARRHVPRSLLERLQDPHDPRAPALTSSKSAWSIAIGALSHVVFDLVTHAHFLVLWPWVPEGSIFPTWWTKPFGFVSLPVYREPYPLAAHTIAWALVSVLGTVLFVRCSRRAGR
jgi:hypothetical protein